jgi:hypothetical protein
MDFAYLKSTTFEHVLLKINVLYLYAFRGWEAPGLIFVEAGKSISKKKIQGGELWGGKQLVEI